VPPAGEVLPGSGEIVLNEGRPSTSLAVTNLGDRPIQVGSQNVKHGNLLLAFGVRTARRSVGRLE